MDRDRGAVKMSPFTFFVTKTEPAKSVVMYKDTLEHWNTDFGRGAIILPNFDGKTTTKNRIKFVPPEVDAGVTPLYHRRYADDFPNIEGRSLNGPLAGVNVHVATGIYCTSGPPPYLTTLFTKQENRERKLSGKNSKKNVHTFHCNQAQILRINEHDYELMCDFEKMFWKYVHVLRSQPVSVIHAPKTFGTFSLNGKTFSVTNTESDYTTEMTKMEQMGYDRENVLHELKKTYNIVGETVLLDSIEQESGMEHISSGGFDVLTKEQNEELDALLKGGGKVTGLQVFIAFDKRDNYISLLANNYNVEYADDDD